MRLPPLLPTALAIALTATCGFAQIPSGHGFFGTFGQPGPDYMVDFARMPGINHTLVRGLSVAGGEINACSIDPVSGILHLGGIGNSGGEIRGVVLNGAVVLTENVLASVGSSGSLKSIDYDRNGHIYTCNAQAIYRISRGTGAVTTWDTLAAHGGPAMLGEFNALCIDMARHVMWVGSVSSTANAGGKILEYQLKDGPKAGVVIADLPALNASGQISGIDDDGAGKLYITTFKPSESVVRYDTASGALTKDSKVPAVALNDVWFSRLDGTLHLIGAGTSDDYWLMPSTGFGSGAHTAKQVTRVGDVGVASNVAVSDFFGRTEAFPQAPDASKNFNLDITAHGEPGEFGVALVTKIDGVPYFLVLGDTVCDGAGFARIASIPIAANQIAKGTKLTIMTVTIKVAIPPTFKIGSELVIDFQ